MIITKYCALLLSLAHWLALPVTAVVWNETISDESVTGGLRKTISSKTQSVSNKRNLRAILEKRLDEVFLVGTHNSLALPGKVFSPNQNFGLKAQYNDGVRFFNFDLYKNDQGQIVTNHGPGMEYDPIDEVKELASVLESDAFVLIQLQDAVGNADILKAFFESANLYSKLIKNFDASNVLSTYIGQTILLVTDHSGSVKPSYGIHDTKTFVTENDYSWTSCYFDDAPMGYRRGPKTGVSFKLMNNFCSLTGTGDMIASDSVNRKQRILWSAREFVKQGYSQGKFNGILIDYYEEGDPFGAMAAISRGDLDDGCWNDGSLCGVSTTCWNCCSNENEWWYSKIMTACGQEPCWEDGKLCGIGTTCNACCNGYEWWYGKAMTACGSEPCWNKGTVCGWKTTCNACCNGAHCPWYQFGVCTCK